MAIERTLVLIRERPLMDLLDLALVVVRRRPVTLGLAALAGIAPFAALNAWLFATIWDMAPGVPLFLWWFEAPLATAPLTLVLGGLMFGERPTARKVAAGVSRAVFPLLMLHGLLRFVPAFWAPPRLAFANEVVLLERARWWKIWRRGGDLASGRAGELFGMAVLQLVITYGFAVLSFIGSSVIVQAILAEKLTWDTPGTSAFSGLRFQVPIWGAAAFFAVARFLTYIDQRIRLEGWEVELRLRAAGEAMEEARRW